MVELALAFAIPIAPFSQKLLSWNPANQTTPPLACCQGCRIALTQDSGIAAKKLNDERCTASGSVTAPTDYETHVEE